LEPLKLEQGERFHETQSDEGRYRLLVEGITDYAIYMLDAAGLVTSWNRGAERFKGYSEGEIIGQHFSRFYTEEDKAIDLPQTALRTAREEGRFEQEGWRVRKDGTRFWAHVVIDPIRDSKGNLVGYAKITRDLSERRRAEEHLRESQEQLRLLVEGVTDYALYMLDLNGRVSSWNAGAERIKGYTRDESSGTTSRVSIPRRSGRRASPAKPCNRRRPKVVGRRKAGACARTVAASGRT
jgi:PAS domain S-box-containing protein